MRFWMSRLPLEGQSRGPGPETGFEEITGHVLERHFGRVRGSAHAFRLTRYLLRFGSRDYSRLPEEHRWPNHQSKSH